MPMSTTCASKTSLDLVADDVVDRLLVELARDGGLDAADQGELGVPLRVSSTSRALSRATLRLPARVTRSRSSASENACSRSTF
jgi:hypothetical protein